MMLIKSSVKYSSIHGLGCYAEEDVKKGQVVWKLDPRFDLELDAKELENLNPATLDFFKMYSYGHEANGKKTFILCADHARHMNHSDDPNLLEDGNEGLNIAARDIKKGEELTCDYTKFDTDHAFKLSHKSS